MPPWGPANALGTALQSGQHENHWLATVRPGGASHPRDLGPCPKAALACSTHRPASHPIRPTRGHDRHHEVTRGEPTPLSLLVAFTQLSGVLGFGALLPCPVPTAPEAALVQEHRLGGCWAPGLSRGCKAGVGWSWLRKGWAGVPWAGGGFGAYLRKRVQGEGGDGADGQQRAGGGGAGPRGSHSTVGGRDQCHLPL